MQNRVQHFITKILQNSRLNREKFVINKKIYNNEKRSPYFMVKRQFGTYNENQNNDPNPWRPFWVIIIATSATITIKTFYKN